jgi:hypothetical protein
VQVLSGSIPTLNSSMFMYPINYDGRVV